MKKALAIKTLAILISLLGLMVFSLSAAASEEVTITNNNACSSTNYLEDGQTLVLEESSSTILEEINIGDIFYLGNNRVQYQGADSITEDSPKIKFKVLESGETLTYPVAILEGDAAAFAVKLSGYTYEFKSLSDPGRQDYTIGMTSGTAYSDRRREVKLMLVGFDSAIDEPVAKFSVDGEDTDKMYEGESYNLADGSVISVDRILHQDYAGGIHAAWFCLNWEAGVPVEVEERPAEVEKVTLPVDLGNYPKLFLKDGRFNGYFVIGAGAPALDTISMSDIAAGLEEEGFLVENTAKLDSEISHPLSKNLIIISSGCSNAFESLLRGCGLREGEALLELYEHNGYAQLLVAGYSPEDTRKAAQVLRDYQEHNLKGRKFVVSRAADTSVTPRLLPVPESVKIIFPEITPPVEAPPKVQCTGCRVNGNCLPYGTRLAQNDRAQYCNIGGAFRPQQELNTACQNSYECLSNQCGNGQCVDLLKISGQLEETNSLLARILAWLERLFS